LIPVSSAHQRIFRIRLFIDWTLCNIIGPRDVDGDLTGVIRTATVRRLFIQADRLQHRDSQSN
jgi:hypothetical protein